MANGTTDIAGDANEPKLTGTSFRIEAREDASTDQYRWYTEYFRADPDDRLVILDKLADMFQEAIQKARGIRDHDDPEIDDKKDALKEKLGKIHDLSKALKRNQDAEGWGSRAGSANIPLVLPDLRTTPDALFQFLVDFDVDKLGTNPVVMHARESLDALQDWINGKNPASLLSAVERLADAGYTPDDLNGKDADKQVAAVTALLRTGENPDEEAELTEHIALSLRDPLSSDNASMKDSLRTIAGLLQEKYADFRKNTKEFDKISADTKEGFVEATKNYMANNPKKALLGTGALVYGLYKMWSGMKTDENSLVNSAWPYILGGLGIVGWGTAKEYSGYDSNELVPRLSQASLKTPSDAEKSSDFYQLFASILPEDSGTLVTSMMQLGMTDMDDVLDVFENAYDKAGYTGKMDPRSIANLSDRLSMDEAAEISPLIGKACEGICSKAFDRAKLANWPELKNYKDPVKGGLAYLRATLSKHHLTMISVANLLKDPRETLREMTFENSLVDSLDAPSELNEADRQVASTLARLYTMKDGFDKAPIVPQGGGAFLIHGYLYRCYTDDKDQIRVQDPSDVNSEFTIDPKELVVSDLEKIIEHSKKTMHDAFDNSGAPSGASLEFNIGLGRFEVKGLKAIDYDGLDLSSQPIQALMIPGGIHFRMLDSKGTQFANSKHYENLGELKTEYTEQVLLSEVLKKEHGLANILGPLDFKVLSADDSSGSTEIKIGYGADHATTGTLTFSSNALSAISLYPAPAAGSDPELDPELDRVWKERAALLSDTYFNSVRQKGTPGESHLKSAITNLKGTNLDRVLFEAGTVIQRVFGNSMPKNPILFNREAWLEDSIWATYGRMQAQSKLEINKKIIEAASNPTALANLDTDIQTILDKNMGIVQNTFLSVANTISTDVKSASDPLDAGKISEDSTAFAYSTLEEVGIKDATFQSFWSDLDPLMTANGFDWVGGDGMRNARRARMAFQNTLMELSWPLAEVMPPSGADHDVAMKYLNYLYSVAEWTLKISQHGDSGNITILGVTIDERIGNLDLALKNAGALSFSEFKAKVSTDPVLNAFPITKWNTYAPPASFSLSSLPAYLRDKIKDYVPIVASMLPSWGIEKPTVDPSADVEIGGARYTEFIHYAEESIHSQFRRPDWVAADLLHPEHEKLRERRLLVFMDGMRQEIFEAKKTKGTHLNEKELDGIIQKYLKYINGENLAHERRIQSPLDSMSQMMQDMLIYPNSTHGGLILEPAELRTGPYAGIPAALGSDGATWKDSVDKFTRFLPTAYQWDGRFGISQSSATAEISMIYLKNICFGKYNVIGLDSQAKPENYTAFFSKIVEKAFLKSGGNALVAQTMIAGAPDYIEWANLQVDRSTASPRLVKILTGTAGPIDLVPMPIEMGGLPAALNVYKDAEANDWINQTTIETQSYFTTKYPTSFKSPGDVNLPQSFLDSVTDRVNRIKNASQSPAELELNLASLHEAVTAEVGTVLKYNGTTTARIGLTGIGPEFSYSLDEKDFWKWFNQDIPERDIKDYQAKLAK
jgi:hypothetical protein